MSGRTDDGRTDADGRTGTTGAGAYRGGRPSKCLKRPNKRNEKVEKRPRKRGDISAAATTIKSKKKKCSNARRTDAE